MNEPLAPLAEVFPSLQGEGAFVGEPQVFLRFAVCPIRCLYCDTEAALVRTPVHRVVEDGVEHTHANPVDVEGALRAVVAAERPSGLRRTVSVTGGEPLVHAAFLRALLPRLREGRRVHLETAGLHPEALRTLLGDLDHVSIDWKLPATLEGSPHEAEHEACLAALAAQGTDTAVKIVLPAEPDRSELERACAAIARHVPRAPVFLQPVTPARRTTRAPSHAVVDACVDQALRWSLRVRVLPQVHKLVGRP